MLSLSYSSSSSFAAAAVAALSNSISSTPSLASSLAYQNSGEQAPTFASNLPGFASPFDAHSHATQAFGYSPSISRLIPKQQARYYSKSSATEDVFSNGSSNAFFLSPAASGISGSSAAMLSPLHSYRQGSFGANRSQLFSPTLPAAALTQESDAAVLSMSDLSRQLSAASSISGLPLPLSRTSSIASTTLSSGSTLSSSTLPSVASFSELNDLLQRNADEETSQNDLLAALRSKVKVESDEEEQDSPRSVHSGVDGVDDEEFFVGPSTRTTDSDVPEAWNEGMVSGVSLNDGVNDHELAAVQSCQQNLRKRKSFSEAREDEREEAADADESEAEAQLDASLMGVHVKAEPKEVAAMTVSEGDEMQRIGDCSSAADEMELNAPQIKEEVFESDGEDEQSSPILSPSSTSSDSAMSTPIPVTLAPLLPRRHDRELANRRERRRAADAQKRLNSLLGAASEYTEIDEVWGMNRAVTQDVEQLSTPSSLTLLDVTGLAPSVGKGYLMMAVESKDLMSGQSCSRLVYCKYVMFEDSVSVSSNNGRRNRRSDTHGLTTQMHLDKKSTVVLAPQECVRQMVAQSQKKKRCRKSSSALAASAHANGVDDDAVHPLCSSTGSAIPSFRILIACADHSNSISWRDEGEGRKQDYYHCLQFRRKQKYQITIMDERNSHKSKLLWLHMLQTKGHAVSFLSVHAPSIVEAEQEEAAYKREVRTPMDSRQAPVTPAASSSAAAPSLSSTASTRRSARIQRQSSSSLDSLRRSSSAITLPALNASESSSSSSAAYYLPSPMSYSLSAPILSSSSAASNATLTPLSLWRGSSLITDESIAAAAGGVGCSFQTQAP